MLCGTSLNDGSLIDLWQRSVHKLKKNPCETYSQINIGCRRLPSICIVQEFTDLRPTPDVIGAGKRTADLVNDWVSRRGA